MVCAGREEGWPKFYFFDRDFKLMRINRDSKNAPEGFALPRPAGLEEAFQTADRLSEGFPFVRSGSVPDRKRSPIWGNDIHAGCSIG